MVGSVFVASVVVHCGPVVQCGPMWSSLSCHSGVCLMPCHCGAGRLHHHTPVQSTSYLPRPSLSQATGFCEGNIILESSPTSYPSRVQHHTRVVSCSLLRRLCARARRPTSSRWVSGQCAHASSHMCVCNIIRVRVQHHTLVYTTHAHVPRKSCCSRRSAEHLGTVL